MRVPLPSHQRLPPLKAPKDPFPGPPLPVLTSSPWLNEVERLAAADPKLLTARKDPEPLLLKAEPPTPRPPPLQPPCSPVRPRAPLGCL